MTVSPSATDLAYVSSKAAGGYQTGRGQSVALNQLFVEFVMTDCDAVEVFRIAEAYRKR